MKSYIYKLIQRQSLRLSLCAAVMTMGTVAYAQDTFDEEDEAPAVKAPKRTLPADTNPTINVQGVVVDQATKKPLAGVRLQTLNDNRYAAMTDAEGKFTMKVPTFATSLYVQAPNFIAQQVAIKANDPSQKIEISMLSSVFAKMYDNGTEYTATSSFTSNGNGIVVDEEIGTKLGADIRTIMHSGNLEQGAAMFIRGINSINASSQPLVIIDGVEMDMQRSRTSIHQGDIFNMLSTLSPEDIDKVEIIKNATALYGARGANGVILISTKRGHSMATRIDAKIGVGTTLLPSSPTMMNASQYRSYAVEQLGTVSEVQEALANAESTLNFKFMDDNPNGYYYNMYHNDTNWKDYVYKNALTHNYSINVQGGDDIGMYNLSVAYIQTMKNIESTSFDRVNVRFNTDISLLQNLTTKFDMSFSRTNTNLFDDGIASDLGTSTITSPGFLSLIKSPLLSPYIYNNNIGAFTNSLSQADDLFAYSADSSIPNSSLGNPLSLIENGDGERKNRNENTFFNVALAPTYEINNNLKITTLFSYYLNRNSQAYYRPNNGMPSFQISGLGTAYSMTASLFSKETNIISNTHIDWQKKFGAHDVAVTGGFRYTYFSYDDTDLSAQAATSSEFDKNPILGIGTAFYSGITGSEDVWKNMQWYVSGDYSYKNRYFATVSVLAEANSRFGENASGAVKAFGTQWAIFPSVQLGWVITNENWFPKTGMVNYLRINAGFDMSGNDDISNYAARTSFSPVRLNYNEVGMQMTNIGNGEIKWETTKKWNFGVQANMLNNRLGVNFNYFIHNTSDLLTLKAFTTPVGGINNYWTNDGSVRNTGVELTISGKPIVTKDWNLEVGISGGHYSNEVTALGNGDYATSIYGDKNILTSVGNAVGVFYGYETAGNVFKDTEEAAKAGVAHVNKNGETTTNLYMVDETGAKVDFQAGDVHFIDQNGDGCIDEQDKVIIGNPNPDLYGNIFATLNWKRFTLNIGFNYCIGNDVYNYQRSILNSGSTLYNQQVAEIGHWRYEGQVTSIPRLAYGDPLGNNRFSDRWIEDGSYLRLKTLSLAYNIPIPESWQTWLQGLSVWGECRNLFTITRYTGDDPEFSISNNQLYQGIDCGNLAQGRSFTVGLKINL